jgi:N-acetylmuramoyl-L-alanine amidase
MRRRPSPNYGPRKDGAAVDMLILHYTGMVSAAAALDRLCDPAAQVSAHYLVEEDGTIWQLVDEGRRAWHAGRAFWAGEHDVNSRSIGIELANPGHEFGYRPFPEVQITALEALARGILARHPIPARRVLGHADVAPQRKQDPGELFPWERLARAGIGIWPDAAPPLAAADAVAALARIGYEVPEDDGARRAVVTAFQRHWRPERCDGGLDTESCARIGAVARVAEETP